MRFSTLLLLAHALEGLEFGAILDQARDVDLRADEVAQSAARVEKGCCHQKVHEWGAIAAAVRLLDVAGYRMVGYPY
ncbi:hypothetical protein HBI25_009490 [Parastagonospora nodorum]|nr:hypothetical protein HBH53_092480 [Parastagonospora nodorum]KAH4005618.1 hypothetical protein HBI10_035020 [Parastagonospora nodorum]KAH4072644.1 hypothetical protein HBH50_062210 [Parastagonospora nodorum]KAH4166023.1 hypothetical protein HBH43_135470 [Parastagonospora nodorum]KAH4208105.1 hypothetical protein HBI95_099570 [Parastagonospora nodorum]